MPEVDAWTGPAPLYIVGDAGHYRGVKVSFERAQEPEQPTDTPSGGDVRPPVQRPGLARVSRTDAVKGADPAGLASAVGNRAFARLVAARASQRAPRTSAPPGVLARSVSDWWHAVEINAINTDNFVGKAAVVTRLGWNYISMDSVKTMVDGTLTKLGSSDRLKRLNIMDHGNRSGMHFGADWVDETTLSSFAADIRRLSGHFTDGGFVHLQGCDVGQDSALLKAFAALVGVRVVAGKGAQNPVYRLTPATMSTPTLTAPAPSTHLGRTGVTDRGPTRRCRSQTRTAACPCRLRGGWVRATPTPPSRAHPHACVCLLLDRQDLQRCR